MRNVVFYGHVLEEIKNIPSNSVDCIITSPPYYFARNYGTDANVVWGGDEACDHFWDENSFCVKCGAWYGQLGLEPDVDMYICHLCDIFDECLRILKPTGNLFINIGDSYVYAGYKDPASIGKHSYMNKKVSTSDEKEHPMAWLKNKSETFSYLRKKNPWIKRKQLLLIPYRLAISLQLRGWIIRDMIVWAKKVLDIKNCCQFGNGMPESVTDRLTKSYEIVIHAVKTDSYYFKKFKVKQTVNSINRTLRDKIHLSELFFKRNGNGFWKDDFTKEEVKSIVNLLNTKLKQSQLTLEQLAEITKIDKEVLVRYFSLDAPNTLVPSRDFWNVLKPILKLPSYDYVIKKEYENALPIISPYASAGNVLFCDTENFRDNHFAVMPAKLVSFLIEVGCPEKICGDCGGIIDEEKESCVNCGSNNYVSALVFDPFLGSGTVAHIAQEKGRDWIGIEINKKYKSIIDKRIRHYQMNLF